MVRMNRVRVRNSIHKLSILMVTYQIMKQFVMQKSRVWQLEELEKDSTRVEILTLPKLHQV